MKKVLFVCLGNICRSPTAEAVFRHLVKANGLEAEYEIDSAGTAAYHTGSPPDKRAARTAQKRGVSFAGLRARQVSAQDFARFDVICAMDHSNVADLHQVCTEEHHHKIRLFLDFSEAWSETEVPDPYYGGPEGFGTVFDMVEDASIGLMAYMENEFR